MKHTKLILMAVLGLALAACASRPNEREMNYLASATTKVAAAVEATVRYRNPPAHLTEGELLRAATAHDESLLRPFAEFTVRVRRGGRHSAVLVCDARQEVALLEDSGCTPGLDAHRWGRSPLERCDFSLNLDKTCTR